MKQIEKRIAAFFLSFLICVPYAGAEPGRSLPEEYVKYPVMVQLDDGRAASGFYITHDGGDAYFVTARHLFFEKDKKDASGLKAKKALLLSYPKEEELKKPILITLDLPVLWEEQYLSVHESRDVAAVKIGDIKGEGALKSLFFSPGVTMVTRGDETGEGTILGAHQEVTRLFADAAVGNDVFIFGYPNSLGIENYPQIDYEKPLLRKGIIAGKYPEKRSLILDCPVFYGNSGGPVVEVVRTGVSETRYYIIGMVSEFIPFDDKWYGIRKPFGIKQIENSGYSVVIPIDIILELIESIEENTRLKENAEKQKPVTDERAETKSAQSLN